MRVQGARVLLGPLQGGSLRFEWKNNNKELFITVLGNCITTQRWEPLDAIESEGYWETTLRKGCNRSRASVTPIPGILFDADDLYRGVNGLLYQEGHILSGAFFGKARTRRMKHPRLERCQLIPLNAFQALTNPEWGVAKFPVVAPHSLGLVVESYPDPLWKEYAVAHFIITGYQGWTNKHRDDIFRQMREHPRKVHVGSSASVRFLVSERACCSVRNHIAQAK